MIYIIIFLTMGTFLGFLVPSPKVDISNYLAVSILAALDSVFGGILANLNQNFSMSTFVSGFFTNALLAASLAYLGNKLGINLCVAALVVFGTRVFNNLTGVRHLIIKRIKIKREIKEQKNKYTEN